MEAARQGHTDTVRALLEKGADAKGKDRDGETALSLAEKQKHGEVAALLKNPAAAAATKLPEKPAPPVPAADPASPAAPAPKGAAVVDQKAQQQAYFRIGMNLQMEEAWGLQSGALAAGWAQNIQQDLAKVGAPKELQDLAAQAQVEPPSRICAPVWMPFATRTPMASSFAPREATPIGSICWAPIFPNVAGREPVWSKAGARCSRSQRLWPISVWPPWAAKNLR